MVQVQTERWLRTDEERARGSQKRALVWQKMGGDEKNEVQWNLRKRKLSDGRKMKCSLCLAM